MVWSGDGQRQLPGAEREHRGPQAVGRELHSERNHFTQDHLRLLSLIATQAAVAIENARLVRQREERLKRQIEELRIEIDEVKKAQQVAEITETEYFQQCGKRPGE